MDSLVGLENPLVRGSFLISWVFWGILIGLVVPCWMGPSSSDITPFFLLVGSLLGGFLRLGKSPRSSLNSVGVWILWGFIVLVVVWVGVLIVEVSKGSDLVRKPDAQWCTEFLHRQFLTL